MAPSVYYSKQKIGKDYRIGTLSKVNNIIYCKNDVLAE